MTKTHKCASPECDKMFVKMSRNARYCGPECALRARANAWTRSRTRRTPPSPPVCANSDCGVSFQRSRADQLYCPDCAREIALEKARRRAAMKRFPPEHVEGVLAFQEACRALTEQTRAARLALYEAYEAGKSQSGKAS